jgi:streptogramin lyase
MVTTFAGNGTKGFSNGQGTAATFTSISGVAVDAQGNAFAMDSGNHVIRKITSSGDVTTFAGSGGTGYSDGSGTSASFRDPTGVVIDPQGNIYFTEFTTHRVCKVTPAGVVKSLAGNGTAGGQDGTGDAATFNGPRCVTLDSQGNLYVTDQTGDRIRKVTPQGVVTTIFGNGIGCWATTNGPAGIALDSRGYIYFADRYNNRIREIAPSGVVTTIAGSGSVTPVSDGTGAAASFATPIGMTLGPDGCLYVADYGNHRIRKVQ